MLQALAGGGMSTSTSDQMSSSSGLTQTIHGISHGTNGAGGNNQVLMIAAAVFLMALFVVVKK